MTAPERPYHHGDLQQVLRLAAAELIAERGPGGFSLREVARRADVSHAAPAHHFGDAAGLLTAVATDAIVHLRTRTSAAWHTTTGDAVDRLAAVGRAYVELSVTHPGHAAVVFRHDLINPDEPDYLVAATAAYGVLTDALEGVAAEVNPDLDIDLAAATCWSAMQGLTDLYATMQRRESGHAGEGLAETSSIGQLAEHVSRMLVDGFRPPRG